MSRKGNSADNGMMESFFGILKSENVFMDLKKNLMSLEELEKAIIDYIDYYNNKRIKIKLDGPKVPVNYRITHSNSARIA